MYTNVEGKLVRNPYIKPKVTYCTMDLDGEKVDIVAFASETTAYEALSKAKKDDKLNALGIKQKDPRNPNVIQLLARDIRPAQEIKKLSFSEYWEEKLQDTSCYYQQETVEALKQARDENWDPAKRDVLPDAI